MNEHKYSTFFKLLSKEEIIKKTYSQLNSFCEENSISKDKAVNLLIKAEYSKELQDYKKIESNPLAINKFTLFLAQKMLNDKLDNSGDIKARPSTPNFV